MTVDLRCQHARLKSSDPLFYCLTKKSASVKIYQIGNFILNPLYTQIDLPQYSNHSNFKNHENVNNNRF